MYLRADLRKFKVRKLQKKIMSANHKPAKCHICGGFTNLTNLRICDLRNLFADRPLLDMI
jgi:hypothetical protein